MKIELNENEMEWLNKEIADGLFMTSGATGYKTEYNLLMHLRTKIIDAEEKDNGI